MDLIERQDAIEAICKACSMEGDYHKCDGYPETSTWCDELVALRALPSAQQWIPCSERLPEEDTYVLATTAWGEITMAEKLSDIAWFICEGNANAKSDDIVAWMPLPEPWKGEE